MTTFLLLLLQLLRLIVNKTSYSNDLLFAYSTTTDIYWVYLKRIKKRLSINWTIYKRNLQQKYKPNQSKGGYMSL